MNASDARRMGVSLVSLRSLTVQQLSGAATMATGVLCLIGGTLVIIGNSFDVISIPLLALLTLAAAATAGLHYRTQREWDRETAGLAVVGLAGLAFLAIMPKWFYGYELNAIIHHSFFSLLVLIPIGTVATSQGMYLVLGATPTGRDISRYPIILLPVVTVIVAYGMILGRIVDRGVPQLSWHVLTTVGKANVDGTFQPGLRNSILGSFLLIAMTIGISLPIGVGAGLYMAEYPGRIARLIGLSAQMLRSISIFIIGSAAVNMVLWTTDRAPDDPISQAIRGFYTNPGGYEVATKGSFLLAASFVALLVIPVIARATEEGLRSVPREIKEGSIALGATDGHGLLNIFLPWAFPIVLTGVLVGAAEAAGATAILVFVAGTGENGVGPLREASTLDVAIFQSRFGTKPFVEAMSQFQYTAAFLLALLTLAFTSTALFIKARAWRRYKGVYS